MRPLLTSTSLAAILAVWTTPAIAQVVSEAEAAQMRAEIRALRARLETLESRIQASPPPAASAPVTGEAAAATAEAPPPAKPSSTEISWKGSPRFAQGDKLFKVKGRIQADANHVSAPGGLDDRGLGFSNEMRRIRLGGEEVADALRNEAVGSMASKISALPSVRDALRELQLSFRRIPGLVADGRDMGTVIFPAAPLKIYLTASAGQRAQRRHKQLISKGIPAILDDLLADLEARDARDMNRAHAPLKPAEDAVLLDNSELDIEQSVQFVLNRWHGQQAFPAR